MSGFELLAVDEEGARAGERVSVLVEVSEQRQAALFKGGGPVLVLALESGDEVVHELGGRGVVANDDEAGWDLDILLPPQLEGLRIVAIEGFESGLELDREAERVEGGSLAATLPWHLLPDVVPEIAELGHVAARDVVGDRDAGKLDDAALDGIHEREVAHRPGEEGSFRIA